MFLAFILGFLSILDLIFGQSEHSLVIFKNNNGIEESISSVLKIKPGENVSLTCKTSDIIPKENYFNSVAWSKQINHDQFKNKAPKKIINMTELSQLNFKPVKIDDRGIYFCTNVKYNLSKKLEIIVQPLHGKSRWKRAQSNYGHGYQWGVGSSPKPYQSNLPPHIQEMVNNFHRKGYQDVSGGGFGDNWNTFDKASNEYPSWRDTSNKNQYDWSGDQSVSKNSYDPPVTESPRQSYTVFYFLGGVVTLLLFGGLCVIVQHRNNGPRRVPVNAIPLPYQSINPHVTAVQTPIQRRLQDPDGDDVLTLLNSLNIAPSVDRSNIQPRRCSDLPLVPNSNTPSAPMICHSDAPPSYDNFVRISNVDDSSSALPSYDEAVTNMGIHLLNPSHPHLIGQGVQNVPVTAGLSVSQNDI